MRLTIASISRRWRGATRYYLTSMRFHRGAGRAVPHDVRIPTRGSRHRLHLHVSSAGARCHTCSCAVSVGRVISSPTAWRDALPAVPPLPLLPQTGFFIRLVESSACSATPVTMGPGVLLGYECSCITSGSYNSVLAISAIVAAAYLIAFPLMCIYLVAKRKPRGSAAGANVFYDAAGAIHTFTDAMYQQHMGSDPKQLADPYRSLFEGYHRDWAFYRIGVMVLKLSIVVVMAALWRNTAVQSALVLVVLALLGGIVAFARPFVSPVANAMAVASFFTASFTQLFGLLGSQSVSPKHASQLAALITTISTLQFIALVLGTLWGARAIRLRLSAASRMLLFSDSAMHRQGNFMEIVATGGWDAAAEVRFRVWQSFWASLFTGMADEGAAVLKDGTKVRWYEAALCAAHSHACACQCTVSPQVTVASRLCELIGTSSIASRERMTAHFAALQHDSKCASQRLWIQRELEGVDVCCNMWVIGATSTLTCLREYAQREPPSHACRIPAQPATSRQPCISASSPSRRSRTSARLSRTMAARSGSWSRRSSLGAWWSSTHLVTPA